MNIALIMAAGFGERMKSDIPKQMHILCGKPILLHSLERFANHPLIDGIYIVCSNELIAEIEKLTDNFPKLLKIIEGGNTRRQSVLNGLNAISQTFCDDDIVLIHDAARPLVTTSIIDENIQVASASGGCTTAIPVVDTVLESNGGVVANVLKRDVLYSAQTPQSFKLKLILNAHNSIAPDAYVTDDTSLMLLNGCPVEIVAGDACNLKLTTTSDIILLEHFCLIGGDRRRNSHG